jgi:DNA-binding MarR family transcriptional regulator
MSDAPSLIYVIGRVDRGVRTELARRLRPWNLTVAQFTTLSVLARGPGLSNAQLARRSLITPQAANEVLAELERRGLVQRSVDPHHARILLAALTEHGAALLRQVSTVADRLQDELLADVPESDRPVVLSGLLSCMRTLSASARAAT